MKTSSIRLFTAALLLLGLLPQLEAASLPDVVSQSYQVLATRQGSASPIPQNEINAARGVAIIDITKGGVVFGGIGGDGVVLTKVKSGLSGAVGLESWSAPVPIGFSGGSFGAQIGGSNTKAIVILLSDNAVQRFTNPGKIGWSASASGTAGADTKTEREGGLLSDVDVKIYQSTDGLYGGAVFGGASLSVNQKAIAQSYGEGKYVRDILEGKVPVPAYAEQLINLLKGKR
jgi:lipid-binding SYLF domain-containing protein